MDQQLTPAADMAAHRRPAFPGESADYAKARQDLLAAEIDFRRHMTRLTAQRQALPPGPLITKDYRFKDEQGFEVGLSYSYSSGSSLSEEDDAPAGGSGSESSYSYHRNAWV